MRQFYTACLLLGAALTAADASALTLTPPSGTSMKYIDAVDFSYDAMVDRVDLEKVYLTDDATGERTYCSGFTALTTDYTRYLMGGTLSFPKVSEPGTYTFTMEAGAVKPYFDTQATNETVTATYTVDADAPEITVFSSYTLSPEPGSTLAKLSRIQITFPKIGYYDTVVIDDAKASAITLTCGDRTYRAADISGYYGTYSFYLAESGGSGAVTDVTEPGTYTLTIPAGTFTNGAEDAAELKGNTGITAVYEVSDNIDFAYTCEPADGSEVSIAKLFSLSPRINFGSDVSSISLTPAVEGAAFSVTLNGTSLEAVANVNNEQGYLIDAYTNSLTIRLSMSLVTERSEFRITAPRGAFTVDGLPSPAIDYTVTYLPPKEFTYEITPDPDITLSELSAVTILFTNADRVEKAYYTRNNAASLTSVRPGSDPVYSTLLEVAEAGADSEYPSVTVTFGPGIGDGNYLFSLPKGEVMVDGDDSPAVECLFRVDSSTGISAPSAEGLAVSSPAPGIIRITNPEGCEVSVCSVSGRQLCRLKDREALIDAAPGIYVVYGGGRSFKLTVR